MVDWMLLLAITVGADADARNWPGFRGDGTGISSAGRAPVSWSEREGIAWKQTLPGHGQSSPVVWGKHVYVTAVEGDQKEKYLLLALDTDTGAIVWRREFAASQKGPNNPMMSRAAPTPVTDADGVYAFFEGGELAGLDHAGELKWKRSLVAEFGEFKNNHGLGGSLAQTPDAVILLADHAGPSYLLAVDKKTGKNKWKTDRPARTSWTTPVVVTRAEKKMILVSSSGTLEAHDGETGKRLWLFEGLTGNNIASPVVHGNLVVVGAGENPRKPDLAASARSNCCLELIPDEPGHKVVWRGKKAVSHHASPLAHRGHAYFVNKTGIVFCIDLKTGEEVYSERLDNQVWASPVASGELIYFFGKDGVTTILRAGPKYEKVASNRLWSADDHASRKESEKRAVAGKTPKPPEGKGPGGGPPVPKEELEATRNSAVGDVVYGVAAIEGAFFLRTGTELICLRDAKPGKSR